MEYYKKRGISLVVLIVTVVVLVILTGAVMISTMGEDSIIDETQHSVDKYNKEAILQEIKLKVEKKVSTDNIQAKDVEEIYDDIEEVLTEFGTYDEHKMQLTTREKGIPIYLYEIVELELEGLVQIDCINNVLTITESDAKLSENGYTYEYSDDNGESWNQYTGETIVSQEDEVIIRLVNTNDKKVITEKVLASKDVNYVTSISIKTPPDNTTYAQGQSFDTSGMVVMATYQDNTTSVITNYQYSPTGPLTVDDTIVTITYTEKGVTKTVTQSITVTNNVESITIVDPATDLDYRQGESFNTSGMIVKATYQDGTESEITNYRVIPNGQLSASDTSVTISYIEDAIEVTTQQAITVACLNSLEIITQPDNITYIKGESFDKTTISVSANYSYPEYPDKDGYGLIVTDYDVTNGANLQVETTSLELSYTDGGITKYTNLAIAVTNNVTNIVVTNPPSKTEYNHGDTFDASGLTITATYQDGTTPLVQSGFSIQTEPLDYKQTSITITYEGKTTTYPITVNRVVSSVDITTEPTLSYYYGDQFDTTGMVVTVTYTDGGEEDVTSDCSISPLDNTTLDYSHTTLTVTYAGVSDTAPLTISKLLTSIAMSDAPYKTVYANGEKFTTTGMVVTAYYNDGTTQNVTSSVSCSPSTSTALTTSNTSVTISYTYGDVTKQTTQAIAVSNQLNTSSPFATQTISGRVYYAPIPKGFAVSTGTISTGLVIQDSTSGNQFVWVPVNDLYNMTSARDTTISNKTILDYWKDNPNGTGTEGKGYNEPYPRDDEDSIVVNEWNAMYASVIKYGGFYVGRYETGNPGTYYPNQLTWSSSTPVIKSGVLPWHTIAAGTTYEITDESSAGIAPTVSRNMYPSSNTTYGAVSTLIYGIQWDTIMNWTGKGSAYVASKSEVGKTGSVSADCYNNIYDLSGNVSEWTMEVYATYDRVYRGGYYGNTETANLRQSTTQWNTNSSCGFRTALYVE